MGSNSFDRIAPFYDLLSKMVFGSTLIDAQKSQLDHIPKGASVLYIGCGTGEIIGEILLRKPTFLHCIDKSERMLLVAQKRTTNCRVKVKFTKQDFLEFPEGEKYDVVITNFFLDSFRLPVIKGLLPKIKSHLSIEGYWIVTEFRNRKNMLKQIMIGFMYLFFRLTANLEGNRLEDFEEMLSKEGLKCIASEDYWSGFIYSTVYKV